ncbi:EAL domain-containing protein [Hylemonella gracilis]|uniref:EAL domain protein n=1 Tax=Hylemonella gracilis ATCC 19624 TaxID=887062 RepID=F3KNL0_9BURK|nr:EAL domain-containing protein [Hylemonella gracilis]EGI78576.1 EAL domain protein [Hylemonella gracilis ATCC 19624]
MTTSNDDVIWGIERGEFHVEYMPIVSLASGECVAAEALVRWKKDGKTVSPAVFIPEIEGTPAIGVLTYWLVEQVALELGAWLRAHRDFHLSLNVPPELFGRGGLQYAAHHAGVKDLYPQFVLELTERGAPDQVSLEGLRSARRLGLGIAIDDVESGNLNLLLLARTKLDYIKIDKSVVDQILSDGMIEETKEEIRRVAASGRPVIVAEGIEHEVQARTLRELGVRLGQGWFFSKSLPVDEFLAFLTR